MTTPTRERALPPGQRRVDGFPRFGTHLRQPPPPVPADAAIEVTGAVGQPFEVPVTDLGGLPRRSITADLHCVAGWSATDLRWEGVPFAAFFDELVRPRLAAGATVTHLVFEGLDRYRSIVLLEDALGHDVLIADTLDGWSLDGDHGAPARLVSPQQYGFVSTKHLCRVEVHTSPPRERYHPSPLTQLGLQLVKPHQRARVWQEERHRYLPAWVVRPVYRRLVAPIRALSAQRANDR